MNEQERYQKTKETIAKFKNGEERYRNSPTFNVVVQILVRGADTYDVIDQLINIADDTTAALHQYMQRTAPPPFHLREGMDVD
jgi:hypothetical protein